MFCCNYKSEEKIVYDVFGKIFRVEEESVTVFDGNVSIKGMT